MTQPHDVPRSADAVGRETGPVFADPSGQRRRVMRVLGAAASVMLVGALIIAGIGLFGGPNTPFSVFAAPHRHGHPDRADTGKQPGSHTGRSVPGGTAPGGRHRSRSASPSHSRTPRRPTSSPTPTNKAGKTPRGRDPSKKPHPSPSPHGR